MKEKTDFISLIFVLSAISPEKHPQAVKNLVSVSKPGTIVCFRDYGRYDMAQLRFKPGKKIKDNFYVRRDGTRYKLLLWQQYLLSYFNFDAKLVNMVNCILYLQSILFHPRRGDSAVHFNGTV